MSQRVPTWLSALGLAVVTGWWLWMMRTLLWLPPASQDALIWLNRSLGPSWLSWATTRKHFVGFRPLTALSYTANGALGGVSAFSFRAVDLGLCVTAGGLLYLLARRWFGVWPALLAAVVYFLHPASEEVAHNLARRSYALSASFVLCGLLTLPKRPTLAGLAFLLGIASNEAAIIPALLSPWILAWRAPDRRWSAGWPALAAVGIMAAARVLVLQGEGGYGIDIIVPWEGRTTGYRGPPAAAPVVAAAGAMYQALLPASGARDLSLLGRSLPGILAGAVLIVALGRGLWRAGQGGRLVLGWFLGIVALGAVSTTWFWRMSYLTLIPLALAAACVARHRQRLTIIAAVLLGLNMVPQSPLVLGLRPAAVTLVRRAEAIDAIETVLHATPPGDVYVVLPYNERRAVSTVRWLRLRSPEHRLMLLAHRLHSPIPVAASSPVRPDSVQIHPEAVLTDKGTALLPEGRLLTRTALPPGAMLLWLEQGAVHTMSASP